MEVQPGLGMSGEEVRARGTAVKSPEKGLCLHWPATQLAHLSLEQEANTASYLELPKPIPGKPWWLSSKESTCNAGDVRDRGSISGSGRPLEEEMATHSSILAWRDPMDRRVWRATAHGVAKSRM